MDFHFDRACGVTPQRRASSYCEETMDAAVSISDFMKPIINPHLMRVNRYFIHKATLISDNQPMVNAFAQVLLKLKEDRKQSWAKIGDAAGVSAQAAHKWGCGGNIGDVQLEKLALHFGISKSALKYGEEAAAGTPTTHEQADLLDMWALLLPEEKSEMLDEIRKRAKHNQQVLAQHAPAPIENKSLPVIQKRTVIVAERRKSQAHYEHEDKREAKHGK